MALLLVCGAFPAAMWLACAITSAKVHLMSLRSTATPASAARAGTVDTGESRVKEGGTAELCFTCRVGWQRQVSLLLVLLHVRCTCLFGVFNTGLQARMHAWGWGWGWGLKECLVRQWLVCWRHSMHPTLQVLVHTQLVR